MICTILGSLANTLSMYYLSTTYYLGVVADQDSDEEISDKRIILPALAFALPIIFEDIPQIYMQNLYLSTMEGHALGNGEKITQLSLGIGYASLTLSILSMVRDVYNHNCAGGAETATETVASIGISMF